MANFFSVNNIQLLWRTCGDDLALLCLVIGFYLLLTKSSVFADWKKPKIATSKSTNHAQKNGACSVPRALPKKESCAPGDRRAKPNIVKKLTKLLDCAHGREEVTRVLNEAMMQQGELDEAFLCFFVDTCIRLGRADVLGQWMEKMAPHFDRINTEHSLSCIIRAYGALRNINGVWDTWRILRKGHNILNCVTLGCMVHALVSNGLPDKAWRLVHDINAKQENISNSVIYCDLIKGFTSQKKFDRIWDIYKELQRHESDLNLNTFNALVDACARCEKPDHVHMLLNHMARVQVKPDLCTYSSALKAFCHGGGVDHSLELLQKIRQTGFTLDEMMYNSLLDGCAKHGLWIRATALLKEMLDAGVQPSTYTLALMVKVGRRGTCSFEEVYGVVDSVSRSKQVRLNVRVYTSLVHLCVDRKDWSRAVCIFSKLVGEGFRPELRTYAVLLNGLGARSGPKPPGNWGSSLPGMTDSVLRAALGLPGAEATLLASAKGDASKLRCDEPLPSQLVQEVLEGLAATGEQGLYLAAQLVEDGKPQGLQIDGKIRRRLVARLANSSCGRPACVATCP